MKIEAATPVETVAACVPGAIAVFESAGVDYCCASHLSVGEAAALAEIDPSTLVTALQTATRGMRDIDWNARPLGDITRQIASDHHVMIREQLPRVALSLANFCGDTAAPETLAELRTQFAELSRELVPHIHDEERYLFRIIDAMEFAWTMSEEPPPLNGLRSRIAALTIAHGSLAQRLHRIRDLRTAIACRADVSPECAASLAVAEQFEAHLRQDMFIENCILFPRALALEEQLRAPAAQPIQ